MKTDPIVENERFERLGKVRELAQRVHANKDRIRRNIEAIDRANDDKRPHQSNLNRIVSCCASKLQSWALRRDADLIDGLVGLLVELPMRSVAPSAPRMPESLDSTHGSFLDNYGAGAKIPRNPGESDAMYRARLRAVSTVIVPPPWANS